MHPCRSVLRQLWIFNRYPQTELFQFCFSLLPIFITIAWPTVIFTHQDCAALFTNWKQLQGDCNTRLETLSRPPTLNNRWMYVINSTVPHSHQFRGLPLCQSGMHLRRREMDIFRTAFPARLPCSGDVRWKNSAPRPWRSLRVENLDQTVRVTE